MSFYLRINEQVEGPFTVGEVRSRLERNMITPQTPAWQVGWPAWQTVAEALQPFTSLAAAASGPTTPPPLPVAAPVATGLPGYTRTLLLAGALFGFDGLIGGQGFLSLAVLCLGVPALVVHALLAWKEPALLRRRFASVGIYTVAALAAITLVRHDQAGARTRAEQVIAACEEFKKAGGDYPKTLAELTPKFLPAIPPARQVGMTTKKFTYLIGGPNEFVKGTNVHVLIYQSIPPIGKAYYVFEEKRWGFYD